VVGLVLPMGLVRPRLALHRCHRRRLSRRTARVGDNARRLLRVRLLARPLVTPAPPRPARRSGVVNSGGGHLLSGGGAAAVVVERR
jgi:hypothetical protein